MNGSTGLASVLQCTVASRPGRGRHENEDAVALTGWTMQSRSQQTLTLTFGSEQPEPFVMALADGMGGRPAGALAARIAVQILAGSPSPGRMPAELLPEQAAGWIAAQFERADDAIRAAATPLTVGLGCAAAYVEIAADGLARIANVGDVRVYQALDGYLAAVTRDDRRPDAEGLRATAITRCLGGVVRQDVRPHLFELQLSPGDALFVVTDGIHEVLDHAELEAAVGDSLPATVSAIALAAAAAGDADDATVVGIRLAG